MTDRELIGQLILIGFTGTQDMDEESRALMEQYAIGNILLFGWNTDTFDQTAALVARVQSYNPSDIPLNIMIDLEGGSVKRFSDWPVKLQSALNLGKAGDAEAVREQYGYIGQKLKETGIQVNLAPVLDMSPGDTFLGTRIFGSDPDTVSAMAQSAIYGLQDAGCISVGKHFPGHYDSMTDSHEALPVIEQDMEELREYGLRPFAAAVDAGVDAVLVAHLYYPEIDSAYITSVSPTFITGILREELGFSGVVISDDLRMHGIRDTYSVGEAAVLHILAGGDMVMIGKGISMQKEVCEALHRALMENRLTRSRIEESVYRILQMKEKYR